MSTTTSRVSLYKPAGGEDVNVTTDLNNNLDKIDTNLNFRVVASATARNAITPYWAGLNVRETDTGKCYVSNGTSPISASWDQIVTANTKTTMVSLSDTIGNVVFRSEGTGQTFAPFYMLTDGAMRWGSGSATIDTTLYRSAADTLKTDDNFVVGDDLTVSGNVTVGGKGFYVISDWVNLSTVSSFASGVTAGTVTPQIRKIMLLGTEVWEMCGIINLSGTFSGSTILSFTGGASSPYTPAAEHNFPVLGGPGSSVTTAQRGYWNNSGNCGISPSYAAGGITYFALDLWRIVKPLG